MMQSRRALLCGMLAIAAGCDGGGMVVDAGRRDGSVSAPDASFCGNGVAEGDEQCDGTSLRGRTCAFFGFQEGAVTCRADCTLDPSECRVGCGDGVIDPLEQCDTLELGGASCELAGFLSGDIACTPTCVLDTSGCDGCGNGVRDPGEACDGPDRGEATCAALGYGSGEVHCTPSCTFDVSMCVSANCGNGAIDDALEECDGPILGGQTCNGLGFFAGTLGCSSSCRLDVSGCTNCGNGTTEGGEVCDGANLGGASCEALGFTRGTLSCTGTCTYNTAGCVIERCGNGMIDTGEACDDGNPFGGDGCTSCALDAGWACTGAPSDCSPICGNGQIHGGEQCDGANLNGATCVSRGYMSGTLGCSASCAYDESACVNTCGNGTLDRGEECEDGNRVAFDGCSPTCQVDSNFHLPVRLRGGEGSNHGRVEVLHSGFWREVCDDIFGDTAAFANVVCRQLGFTGTGHTIIPNFGGGLGAPLMDDVSCTGSEPNLSQCAFRGWSQHNCEPSESVGVRCVPGPGDVRLVGGTGNQGRLQVFHAGAWGEVCDDYWEDSSVTARYNADTVCQGMGYRSGSFVDGFDAPSETFVLDDVRCTGSERRIVDCPRAAFGVENCAATEGLGIRCESYSNGDLRLVAGDARNRGRVEVLNNMVWGTVCDDLIDAPPGSTEFARVACRQLRYTESGSVLLTGAVVDGTDPIWLDDLMCGGTETRLNMCPNRGWGVHNCSHAEDIGLVCAP